MQKVDILLPIYNSFEETKNCINSILENTEPGSYNLFLLNDCSPDNRIAELIAFYSDNHSHIKAVTNKENLGFPGNVNNGFAITENDIIILNSDTLVTETWLRELEAAAYQDKKIAAVNPLSNYGIISGVPTSNSQVNDLFTFEELEAAFKKSKQQGIVEVPLLIGFCMYMKRTALNKVGYFDAEAFKRGYGEETDWCMRAKSLGFELAVAKNSYVHHIGGTSFGPEKEILRRKSKKILLERYPDIDKVLEIYVKGNTLKDVRRQMMKSLDLHGKKPARILRLKWMRHYLKNLI